MNNRQGPNGQPPAFGGPPRDNRGDRAPPQFGDRRPGFQGGVRPNDGRDGPRPPAFQGRDDRGQNDRGQNDRGQNGWDRRDSGPRADGRRDYRPSFGPPGFRPGGERPRYSQDDYPRQVWAHDRYQWRGGDWRGPRGFYYRRWNYGEYLPFGWFTANWFMNDYWAYDLPVPPYGCEWIRSGPDALLVDARTGFIVETVYGVFY